MVPSNLTLASLQQQSLVLDLVADSVLIHDLDGNIIFANKSAYESRGYMRKEMIGMKLSKIIIPEQNNLFSQRISELLKTGELHFESTHMRKDGSVFSTATQVKLIEIEGDKYCCSFIRDITERKLYELALKQSEAKYRRLYNETPVLLHSIDRDARVVDVNDYWLKTMGYERNEVIGRKITDFYTEASRKYAQEVIQPAFFQDGVAKEIPYQFAKKNGQIVDVLLSATAERDSSGNVVRSQAVIEDITDRKRAEAALRESEERFRSLSNASLEGIMIHDHGVILDANTAFVRLFGYDQPEELIGKNGLGLILTPESRARISQRMQRQESGPLEVTCVRKDGTTFVAETDSQPAKYRSHDARIVSCRDITERKRLEDERRLSEERFRKIFEESPIGIAFLDLNRQITQTNQRYRDFLGYSEAEILERGPKGLLHPDDWEASMEMSTRFRSGELPLFHMEQRYIRKDGQVVWSDTIITAIRDQEGRLIHTIGWVQDITGRKRAEEVIRQEIEFSNAIIDSLPGVFYLCDEWGALIRWNNNEKEKSGYSIEELSRMNIKELFAEPQREQVAAKFNEILEIGRSFIEAPLTTKSGVRIPFYFTGYRMIKDGKRYVVGVGIDISEQKRLENLFHQAQKMEAIGQLAGGVAHDFNNILTAIIGYGNVALMKMTKDDPQRLNIEHMLDAGERASHLTKDLLLFSRKQISERKPIDLNDVILKVEAFLKRVIGEDIECKTTHFAGVLPILGDAHQLEQVLMNLATNARDAMPKGGIFSVTTDQVKFDNEFFLGGGYGKPGNYALVTISDTGKGMDEVTKEHIFEPFFTTKEVGKGTGLGLAVVYGIVKQHEGAINVTSETGQGTTFNIYLPLIAVHVDVIKAPVEDHPTGGTETILLAEDDENVRNLDRTVLESFGYTVITAIDGQDAVNKYKENMGKVHLLLFDIIMPRKTGKEAYDEIQAMMPEVKVLFVSGYAPDEIRKRVLINDRMPMVIKPIAPRELLKKVRETLDR